MTEEKERSIKPPQEAKESFFGELYINLKLILRLLKDRRVPFWLKLLPIGALIYLLVPFDLFPIVPIDDAMIIWLGGYLFIELCPLDVVSEHLADLRQPIEPAAEDDVPVENVVDAEFTEAPEGASAGEEDSA